MMPAVLQGFGPSHQQLSNTQGRLRSLLGAVQSGPSIRGVRYRGLAPAFCEFLWYMLQYRLYTILLYIYIISNVYISICPYVHIYLYMWYDMFVWNHHLCNHRTVLYIASSLMCPFILAHRAVKELLQRYGPAVERSWEEDISLDDFFQRLGRWGGEAMVSS